MQVSKPRFAVSQLGAQRCWTWRVPVQAHGLNSGLGGAQLLVSGSLLVVSLLQSPGCFGSLLLGCLGCLLGPSSPCHLPCTTIPRCKGRLASRGRLQLLHASMAL